MNSRRVIKHMITAASYSVAVAAWSRIQGILTHRLLLPIGSRRHMLSAQWEKNALYKFAARIYRIVYLTHSDEPVACLNPVIICAQAEFSSLCQ